MWHIECTESISMTNESDLPGVLCHIDDIVVFGSTPNEHDSRFKLCWNESKLLVLNHLTVTNAISPSHTSCFLACCWTSWFALNYKCKLLYHTWLCYNCGIKLRGLPITRRIAWSKLYTVRISVGYLVYKIHAFERMCVNRANIIYWHSCLINRILFFYYL